MALPALPAPPPNSGAMWSHVGSGWAAKNKESAAATSRGAQGQGQTGAISGEVAQPLVQGPRRTQGTVRIHPSTRNWNTMEDDVAAAAADADPGRPAGAGALASSAPPSSVGRKRPRHLWKQGSVEPRTRLLREMCRAEPVGNIELGFLVLPTGLSRHGPISEDSVHQAAAAAAAAAVTTNATETASSSSADESDSASSSSMQANEGKSGLISLLLNTWPFNNFTTKGQRSLLRRWFKKLPWIWLLRIATHFDIYGEFELDEAMDSRDRSTKGRCRSLLRTRGFYSGSTEKERNKSNILRQGALAIKTLGLGLPSVTQEELNNTPQALRILMHGYLLPSALIADFHVYPKKQKPSPASTQTIELLQQMLPSTTDSSGRECSIFYLLHLLTTKNEQETVSTRKQATKKVKQSVTPGTVPTAASGATAAAADTVPSDQPVTIPFGRRAFDIEELWKQFAAAGVQIPPNAKNIAAGDIFNKLLWTNMLYEYHGMKSLEKQLIELELPQEKMPFHCPPEAHHIAPVSNAAAASANAHSPPVTTYPNHVHFAATHSHGTRQALKSAESGDRMLLEEENEKLNQQSRVASPTHGLISLER